MSDIPTRTEYAQDLLIGDELADGTYLVDRYEGTDGLWLEWSDGDMGYTNPLSQYRIVND